MRLSKRGGLIDSVLGGRKMTINEQYEIKLLNDLNDLMIKHYGEPKYNITSKDNADKTRTYIVEVKGIGLKFKSTDKDHHLALGMALEAAIWEIKRRAETDMYGSLKEDEIDKEESEKLNELMNIPEVVISFLSEYRNMGFEEDPTIKVGKNKKGEWECIIESKEAFLKICKTADTKKEALEGASRLALGIIYPLEATIEPLPSDIQA